MVNIRIKIVRFEWRLKLKKIIFINVPICDQIVDAKNYKPTEKNNY